MGATFETADWKRLENKRWSEFSDAEKRQLILLDQIHHKLNLLLNTIEKLKPIEAQEIERFKRTTLDPLALPDPFEDGDATDEEAADREALTARIMAGD